VLKHPLKTALEVNYDHSCPGVPGPYLRGVKLLLLIWLLSAVAVGASGRLAAVDGLQQLLIPAMILLPIVVFAVLWRGNVPFRRAMLAIDSGKRVILHSWRMLGGGFLMLYAHGLLPTVVVPL
jgi:hypothetical protein